MRAALRPMAAAALSLALATPAHAQAPSGSTVARVTSYCLDSRAATGEWTRPGMVAVDPRVIPLYSTLSIEGLSGEYTALDTGGGVVGDWVDVWFESCGAALNWGVQYREVTWWP
jgi:3D (Asp-Asp-Asp) domain-containing protein